jgi:hypothetical protein
MTPQDSRIVLRDPNGSNDAIVSHPGQPEPYVDQRGVWQQLDRETNWRLVDNSHLRVYDLTNS